MFTDILLKKSFQLQKKVAKAESPFDKKVLGLELRSIANIKIINKSIGLTLQNIFEQLLLWLVS